jgi:ABC-type transport system substrate-binding protein
VRVRRYQQATRPRRLLRAPGLAAAAVAVALAAAACGGSSGNGGAVKEGGLYRLGSSDVIDSLDPFVAFNSDAYSTFEYIYPMLVQFNTKVQFAPDFARSWQVSPDGLTWTFHTQPNAKWSDGKPLTATDAAWTYSTILKYQNGATANSAGYVAHMKSATAPDATTLVLTYKRPVGNVLSQVQQVPILPEHIWAKYATGSGKALMRFSNGAPIVSGGPFILDKYTPKQIALFKRNPNFYGPKPHIDGFGLHPMSYTVIIPNTKAASYTQRSFQIIQGDFKKIGVKLNEKTLDDSAAYDAILANHYRNFEISLWDWYPLPDPDFMLSVLTCVSWNVWNDTGYCSKSYDGLYKAQSAAIDQTKRQQIIYQMQRMVASQRMYLVVDYPDSIEAHSPAWTNLPLVADSSFSSMSKIPYESVHRVG